MNNEKMMILKMLEDKKITADEAAKLLESVGDPEGKTFSSTGSTSTAYKATEDRTTENRNTSQTAGSYTSNNQSQNSSSTANFEQFASDMSKKFEVFAKDFEPKLQKFTETLVQKTSHVADKLSKTIQSYATTESTERKYTPPRPSQDTSINFELLVKSTENQLNITSVCGDITLKGYNGDKITAKISYKAKRPGSAIELESMGNKYILNYNEEDFEHVHVDAFIPENLFSNVIVGTAQGTVQISTLNCTNFIVNNHSGATAISNVRSENIKIDCSNNVLTLTDVQGTLGKIENYNGSITLQNTDIEKMKLDSFNCAVNVNMLAYALYREYVWEMEGSNGKMYLNLPTDKDLAYYINGRTTLNEVKLNLVEMEYMVRTSNCIEAKSLQYDLRPKHVLLRLETSNAAMIIN